MTRQRTATATGLWGRATQALGKLWAGMVSLPDDRRQDATRAAWTDFSRFPPF
ncbi:MAG TPA: hypothetical protein VG308_20155 [Stellaceae bacterium]|jgi:hypothetical protein|nr:hypothetical protein [Stellaceae bacterium]